MSVRAAFKSGKTMTSVIEEAAAQFLYDVRRRGVRVPNIPVEYRPIDAREALAIQQRVVELVGEPIGGWKSSMPSISRPLLYGPIFAPSIVDAEICHIVGTGPTMKVEPEIAFVLARDLPARSAAYTEEEVRDAVRETRLVLEIVGPRYEDPKTVTYPELLADNVANEGLYLGPVVRCARERSLAAFPITIRSATHELAAHEGKHPDGDPLKPLHWLANRLAAVDMPLRAGQIVTTGSYCGIVEIPVGQPVTFTCGDVGEVTVTLIRATEVERVRRK